MNIFYLHTDAHLCAAYHCDKHVIKMIVEYAQLLSNAHHIHGSIHPKLYKATHVKHPCTLWVSESLENYEFLKDVLYNLFDEYNYRYGMFEKYHKTQFMMEAIDSAPSRMDHNGHTEVQLCMPDQYKEDHPCYAYRKYYLGDKVRFAKWKNRDMPLWFHTKNIQDEGFYNEKRN